MPQYKALTQADLAAFSDMLYPERVLSGDTISEDYARDEMTEYGTFMPDAVLLVQSTDEVSRVLAYCNMERIALTTRGAGTGLCGGCVAIHGGIVLSTARMDR